MPLKHFFKLFKKELEVIANGVDIAITSFLLANSVYNTVEITEFYNNGLNYKNDEITFLNCLRILFKLFKHDSFY